MFEIPTAPIQDLALWRTPGKIFEINNSPDSIYLTSQCQSDIERVFYSEYNGTHLAICDLYNIQIYKFEKIGPYTKKQAQINRSTLELKTKKAIQCLALDKNLVVATSDGKISVYDISQSLMKQSFVLEPVQQSDQKIVIRNLMQQNETIICSINEKLFIYNNQAIDKELQFNRPIVFCKIFKPNYCLIQLNDNIVHVIDLKTEKRSQIDIKFRITKSHQNSFIPELIACGLESGKCVIADLRNMRMIEEFVISAAEITAVQFSPSHPDIIMIGSTDFQQKLFRFGYKSMQIIDLSENLIDYQIVKGIQQIQTTNTQNQGLIQSYFDKQNILSIISVSDIGLIKIRILPNTAQALNWLNNLARHYFVNDAKSLQTDVYECMYRRDISAALNVIFDEVKSQLEDGNIDGADLAFKYFDKCILYLRTCQQPDLLIPPLAMDLGISSYLQNLFKRIPLNLKPHFCVHPTTPDTLQHSQYNLLIKLKKLISQEQFNAQLYEQCIQFVQDNSGIVINQLLHAMMDYVMKYNLNTFCQQKLALDILKLVQKSQIERIVYRAVLPSIFSANKVKINVISQQIVEYAKGGRFNADLFDFNALQNLYKVLEEKLDYESLCAQSLVVRFFQLPGQNFGSYLQIIKVLRQDYITKDSMIEQLQISDVLNRQQIIDQPTFWLCLAHLFSANKTQEVARMLVQTAQTIKKLTSEQNRQQEVQTLYQDVQCQLAFYKYVMYLINMLWRIILNQYDQIKEQLDTDSAYMLLEQMCQYLQQAHLAVNIQQNGMTKEFEVYDNRNQISEMLKEISQCLRANNDQLDAEYSIEAAKSLGEALKVMETLGHDNICSSILDLIQYFKGK
ncbi:Conserved_hypothetical protein [Hexamita inflata]|uniref:Uncharacterized protein n=1 Tax=Hexamita inflata TaxID=28002 RepID=A0ABP1GW27_9EUKA